MESDDDLSRASFFDKQSYTSKQDIVQAVIRYNSTRNRPFRVISSDKRCDKATCTQEGCEFVVQFAFSQTFRPLAKFIQHSFALYETTKSSCCEATGKQIALDPMVREMLVATGRALRSVTIQQKLKMAGITASYHALRRLHLEFFGSDADQYTLLPSYIDELNRRGHKTSIEPTGGVFKRVWIAYREGIEAYTSYHERGMAVDGTSLKTPCWSRAFVTEITRFRLLVSVSSQPRMKTTGHDT
ncbi:hypothetical protein DVH05_009525 [Phytophthora capsici]|nr:hypothetical protein DVH05_009525 [Phytophthora capsici]